MKNKNRMALALMAVALISGHSMRAEVITAIAEQCEVDETSVIELMDEVMAAKTVAELDMQNS